MKTPVYKVCLFIIFIGCLFTAKAQNDSLKIDSLKKVLLTEKEDTNKVNTLNAISHSFYIIGNLKKVIQYSNQALSLSKKINFKNGEAYAYLGIASGNEEYLPEYLKNSYASLKAFEEAGNKYGVAQSFQEIGNVYIQEGNDSEALKNLNLAIKIFANIGAKVNMAQCYNNLGDIYLNQRKYNKAFERYQASLKIFQEPDMLKWTWGLPLSYASIAQTYQAQGDSFLVAGDSTNAVTMYLKAYSNSLISLEGYQQVGMMSGVAALYQYLGEIDIKLKKISEANQYLQKSLQIIKSLDDKELFSDVYKSLSTLDSIQRNYKQAYEYYKLHILYRDSLNNEESKKKFVQTRMEYEFAKKESIAKTAQDKKDLEAKRIKNQQFFTILALGVVVLAVVVIALIQFRNNNHKQKANLLLERQKQKVESTLTELKSTQAQLIQSEKMASLGELTAGIAHEIQNPLNFVNNFSEVNKEMIDELQTELKAGNVDEAVNLSNDIKANEEKINYHGKRADSIVKGMLQHSRQTKGMKESTDINALCDEYLRLAYHVTRAKDKNFKVDFKTDFDESIGKINIVPQDIGRVLLNLFNNAFYAINDKQKTADESYKPLVSVQTKKVIDKIKIAVSDNGNGIPENIIDKIFQPFFTTKPTGEGTGLGLSLSYDIITKEHNGTIKVESKEREGTMFIIQLSI